MAIFGVPGVQFLQLFVSAVARRLNSKDVPVSGKGLRSFKCLLAPSSSGSAPVKSLRRRESTCFPCPINSFGYVTLGDGCFRQNSRVAPVNFAVV